MKMVGPFQFFLISLSSILLLSTLAYGLDSFPADQEFQPPTNWFPGPTLELNGEPISLLTTSGQEVTCSAYQRNFYRCDNGGLFDSANPFDSLLTIDTEGNLTRSNIESIVSLDGDILFVNRSFQAFGDYGLPGMGLSQDYTSYLQEMGETNELNRRLIEAHSRLMGLQIHGVDKDDPFFSPLYNALNQEVEELQQALRSPEVMVQMPDGSNLQCVQSYEATEDQPNAFTTSLLPSSPECSIYQCQDIGLPSGEALHLYFSPSSFGAHSTPLLIRSRGDELLGFEDPTEIKSNSDGRLLYRPISNSDNVWGGPLRQGPFDQYGPGLFSLPQFNHIENENGRLQAFMFLDNAIAMENACVDSPQIMTETSKMVKEVVTNAELVQVFSFLDGNMLSAYVDPSMARRHFCHEGDRYYSREAFERRDDFHFSVDQPDSATRRVLTPEEAQALHDRARAMDDIAWNYKTDGCYARAHLMARRFEEEGHYVEKAWINGNLLVEGPPPINWGWHVAPSVYVAGPDGTAQRMIIDPSLADGPITPEQWSAIMTQHIDERVQVTAFPFPSNSVNYYRASLTFTNSDPYFPTSHFDLTEEAKMEMAQQTMRTYLRFQ